MNTVFLRISDADDKETALRQAIRGVGSPQDGWRVAINIAKLGRIPGTPFAYWLPDAIVDIFARGLPFESPPRVVRTTNNIEDNFRFGRLWFEVINNGDWRPWSRGTAQRFYSDIPLLVAWDGERHTYRGFIGTKHRPLERPASVDLFERPGITWPLRARAFSPSALPAGTIFSSRSFMLAAPANDLLWLLALASSGAVDFLCKVLLGRTEYPEFTVTALQRVPFPSDVDGAAQEAFATGARLAWGLRRSLDTRVETSHAFALPALLQVEGGSLAARADAWSGRVRAVEAQLARIQAEIDERCFDLYGIDETDRGAMRKGLISDAVDVDKEALVDAVDEGINEPAAEAGDDAAGLAAELVSWALGVAFGRFDVRLATGERRLGHEPQPFDPLPARSPAMLVDAAGLPTASPAPTYPIDFPASGVLVDDPGDPRDLIGAVRAVFEVVFGASADARWDEAAALLDPRAHDLRTWLRSGLFESHLKQYSGSRRKAPILWQLGAPSGRYSTWLYAHRLTDDSLFQLQNDVVAPKLAYEERQLLDLVRSAGETVSSQERRLIAAQETFVEELRALLQEVKRVAPLWSSTLDDGIILVMAPLWRLVPHKSWQRELKKKWSELAAGKYDWAQLAMHLWPERVVPKCADDRSLAIAHRLEDVFWVEHENGKWNRREEPTVAIDDLIRERTSVAAKDAMRTAA